MRCQGALEAKYVTDGAQTCDVVQAAGGGVNGTVMHDGRLASWEPFRKVFSCLTGARKVCGRHPPHGRLASDEVDCRIM